MARLISPVQFTQQPQWAAPLNSSLVSQLGITSAWVGSQPKYAYANSGNSEVGVFSSSITSTPADVGVVASFNNIVSERIEIAGNSNDVLGTSSGTIAVLRRCRDTTARDTALFGYGATNDRVLSNAPWSDGNLYWDFGNSNAGSGRISVAYTKDTNWETLVFVAGPTKGREVWRRGAKIASNTAATASRPSNSLPFRIGGVMSTSYSDNTDVALLVTSNLEWTDAQIADWTANPWSVFKSPPRKLWVSPPLHTLIVPNSYQSPSSDTGIATQNHTLSGSASGQTSLSYAGIVTQAHTLTGTASGQTASSVAGKVAISYSLAAGSVTQTAGVTTGAASQIQAIAGASNTQSPISEANAITQGQIITGSSTAQNITTESGLITQNQVIAGTNTSQGATTTNGSISLSFVLTATPIAQNASSSQSSITQDQFMVFPPSVQDSISAASPIVQAQMLMGSDSVQLATSWYAIHYFMKAEVDVHPVVHAEFSTRGGVRARAKIVKR